MKVMCKCSPCQRSRQPSVPWTAFIASALAHPFRAQRHELCKRCLTAGEGDQERAARHVRQLRLLRAGHRHRQGAVQHFSLLPCGHLSCIQPPPSLVGFDHSHAGSSLSICSAPHNAFVWFSGPAGEPGGPLGRPRRRERLQLCVSQAAASTCDLLSRRACTLNKQPLP